MNERRHHPLPADAPHALRTRCRGWWVLPAVVLGAFAWAALLLLLV